MPPKAKGQSKKVTPAKTQIRADKHAPDDDNHDNIRVYNHIKKIVHPS